MIAVDIDRFIADHQDDWRRLETLIARGEGRRALTASELEELVRLYERTSTHLSIARTEYGDPGLVAALTRTVGRARIVIYGRRTRTWRAAGRFIADTFPAAVWHARRQILAAAALFLVPAAAMALWLASSTVALDAAAPPGLREAYVEEDFAAYYSSQPSAQFASWVTTNNIQVSILAFAGGVLLCVPAILVLLSNGAGVGTAAGMFAAGGEMARFWGLILPHGLLELTAVFIAGGAGLRLGWTLVDPGDRPRSAALAEEGRRSVAIVVGLVGAFVVAGIIEGFVTGSSLATWIRVGIGVTAEAAFLAYILVRGRAAAARGVTGALEVEVAERPSTQPALR